jgi:small-conductance mechanosensitive channel
MRAFHQLIVGAAILVAACTLLTASAMAQATSSGAGARQKQTGPGGSSEAGPAKADLALAPAKVDVKPLSLDEDIRTRLQNVLDATDWFVDPHVRVEDGVVFLTGQAESGELKKWAGDLARNTQDVVAVANRMVVPEPSIWDFRPAWRGLLALWRDFIHSLPFLFFAMLILVLSAGAGMLVTRGARSALRKRIQARILRRVIAITLGVLVFLIGTYIVLKVSGLTQLALTVVGGTGLVGLALGIAFRDITENFLASIFLSIQRPFESGDLIEVSEITGYVQQLNMRTTIVMTLEGILVQIPNAGVYKSTIRNFSTNRNRRDDFVVGIGYDDSINKAQEIALQVLIDHPAVLDDPEPSVLADSLGKATVNLRVYFWLNSRDNSWLKVRSSVIRLIKLAFQQNGISMPDEAREVVFPQGIPVTMVTTEQQPPESPAQAKHLDDTTPPTALDAASTKAEGGLSSEAPTIEKQARQAQPLDDAENLLADSTSSDASRQ